MATKNEEILRKPDWLKIKLNTNENYTRKEFTYSL